MTNTENAPSPKELITTAMAELNLTIESEFIPFNESRNADNKERSLNWRVTLKSDGRAVLTTDYSAGVAHCPSYRFNDHSQEQADLIAFETHKGEHARFLSNVNRVAAANPTQPILPDPVNVLASLLNDADVLDHPSFESWASDLGYDTDSRAAEKTYQACLKIALTLRVAVGDNGLAKLRTAAQDY